MVQTGAGSAPRRARKQLIFGRQGDRLLLALPVPNRVLALKQQLPSAQHAQP